MSEPTPITKFKLSYKLDATLSVNDHDWIKPGTEVGITWTTIPTDEELQAASKYLITEVLEPMLNEVVETVAGRVAEMEGMTIRSR